MRIGEAAARAGVNVQTFRYYERRGLLDPPPRGPSGYRDYPEETVRLVRFVKRAQELGFSLGEIATLTRLRQLGGRPRGQVRTLAERKLGDVDGKIRQLRAIRRALQALVDTCCDRTNPVCPILDALEDGQSRARRARSGPAAATRRPRVTRRAQSNKGG